MNVAARLQDENATGHLREVIELLLEDDEPDLESELIGIQTVAVDRGVGTLPNTEDQAWRLAEAELGTARVIREPLFLTR
jgi:hypothetical protein